MDENYILRQEYSEFSKRIDDENHRQNRRIEVLEENVKEIHSLTVSMERMAVNMENMLAAIERQGTLIEKQNSRIDRMEQEPAGRWKGIKSKAIDTAVAVIITALVVGAVILAAQYVK